MKRNIQKAAAFSCVLALTALLACPNVTAESKPGYQARTILDNQYDAVVAWDEGALLIKNGSMDSITDKTEMKLVKSDGTISDLANPQKFDKICMLLSNREGENATDSYNISDFNYNTSSRYLVVGKDGKKALLKEDGSFVDNALYEDILSVTDDFVAVKENDNVAVYKIGGSAPLAKYPASDQINLHEADSGLFVINCGQVVGVFDPDLQPIDLSEYEKVWYSSANGNYVWIFSDREIGMMSATGKVVVPPEYNHVSQFTYKNRTYFYAYTIGNNDIQSFVIYQDDGTMIASGDGTLRADNLDQNGGYAILQTGKTYGIFDFNSRTVKLDPVYSSILSLDDHCFAYTQNGKFGVKTYDNRDILAPGALSGNVHICSIGGGRIVVNVDDDPDNTKSTKSTAYIYDADSGKLLAKTNQYNMVGRYYGGTALTYSYTGDKCRNGLLDESGNEIVSPDAYDSLEYYAEGTEKPFYAVSKSGKVGLLDSKGTPVLEFKLPIPGRIQR